MSKEKLVKLSYSQINRAVNAMTGVPYLEDKTFQWLEEAVIKTSENIEKFNHLREICKKKTPIKMQPMRESRDITRDYPVNSVIYLKSKEFFEIGRGATVTKFRVHCLVKISDILQKLEQDGNYHLLVGKKSYHIEEFSHDEIEQLRLMSILFQIHGMETHLFECPNNINKKSSLADIEKFAKSMQKVF